MQRLKFINNQIYHIFNRGVEKRKIFLDEQDKFRFIHDLFEFNNEDPTQNIYYRLPDLQSRKIKAKKPRKLIVEILAFCLMPNHFHLLLRQKKENGITEFMRKLGTGYTNYFNLKYKRSGVLYQGKFKAVPVIKEAHLIYLPHYIHLNPLGLIEPNWRRGEIKNFDKAIKFLETYRWSSFLDYIGEKNFPSITQRDFLLDIFQDSKTYKQLIFEWLKEIDLEKLEKIKMGAILLD